MKDGPPHGPDAVSELHRPEALGLRFDGQRPQEKRDEIDGPEEIYIVIVDNGRSKIIRTRKSRRSPPLHPLRSLPGGLSGLAAGWRVRLRLGLLRSHGPGVEPDAPGPGPDPGTLPGLHPMRGLQEPLPGGDRPSQPVSSTTGPRMSWVIPISKVLTVPGRKGSSSKCSAGRPARPGHGTWNPHGPPLYK